MSQPPRWVSASLPQLGFGGGESSTAGSTSLQSLVFSHALSLPFSPQSTFCTTALPPLIHQCKSPANFLNKQVCWLLLLNTLTLGGHTHYRPSQKQQQHTHSHSPWVAVQHTKGCCTDICSMMQIETDTASLCVWPNSCWHKYTFSNSAPSKNGRADVSLFNDKLLMCLSTPWFTSVLFTSPHYSEAPQGTCG